jgi:hypothetical protein
MGLCKVTRHVKVVKTTNRGGARPLQRLAHLVKVKARLNRGESCGEKLDP